MSGRTAGKRSRLPSPSMIVALIALFVALSGSAYALSRGEVQTRHIANEAVTTAKLDGGSVTAAKLRSNAVRRPKIADGAVGPAKVQGSAFGPGVVMGRINNLNTGPGFHFGSPFGTSAANAQRTAVEMISPPVRVTIRDLRLELTTAPGAGKQRNFGIVLNAATISGCELEGSATACNSPLPIEVPPSSRLAVRSAVGIGDAAPADALFSYRVTMP